MNPTTFLPDNLVASLDRFASILPALTAGISLSNARWRPDPVAPAKSAPWSILEVVMHLGDEEVDDFRTRLRLTLDNPEADWPAIDPEGWARDRRYNDASLADAVNRFIRERKQSIAWLRSLRNPDWSRAHKHPEGWSISAGDLLVSWAVHDHLHLRQITKRLYELNARDGAPYSHQYAGAWTV